METMKRAWGSFTSYFRSNPNNEDENGTCSQEHPNGGQVAVQQDVDVSIVGQQTGQSPVSSSADDAVKRCLHSVKICKHDATQLERELQGELFDKWEESCEVMKATKISFQNISAYLDHLQDAYEGISPEVRKRMDGVLFAEESWEYKMFEWKFMKANDSVARYGMIAFGRSPDKEYVDCMYVMYKMDFKVSPQQIVTTKQHSALWGLFKWQTESVEEVERQLGSKSIESMQNFFRLKALQGFYKEGLIESINYVPSLEDIPPNN